MGIWFYSIITGVRIDETTWVACEKSFLYHAKVNPNTQMHRFKTSQGTGPCRTVTPGPNFYTSQAFTSGVGFEQGVQKAIDSLANKLIPAAQLTKLGHCCNVTMGILPMLLFCLNI